MVQQQEVTNFGRFYGLFRKLAVPSGMAEEVKEQMVWQYSDGRTHSLRELRKVEYVALCEALQREVGGGEELVKRMAYRLELKGARSVALKLMQRMGIDTTCWQRVNDFCRDARICGKEFRSLQVEELKALAVKLRAIERHGGLKRSAAEGGAARDKEEAGAKGSGRLCNIKMTLHYGTEKTEYGEC